MGCDFNRIFAKITIREHHTSPKALARFTNTVMDRQKLLPTQIAFLESWDTIVQPNRFNGQFIFKIEHKFSHAIFSAAVLNVTNNHAIYRSLFYRQNNKAWTIRFGEKRKFMHVPLYDFSHLNVYDAHECIKEQYRKNMNTLDIEHGRVIEFCYYKSSNHDNANYFSVIGHHLVFDFITAYLFFNELFESCKNLLVGKLPKVVSEETSIPEYVSALQRYTNLVLEPMEASYWKSIPWKELQELPMEIHNEEGNTVESYISEKFEFNSNIFKAFRNDVLKVNSITLEEALTAYISHSISQWTEHTYTAIDEISNGRNFLPHKYKLNVWKTHGWFTLAKMIVLPAQKSKSALSILKSSVNDIRKIPSQGLGYLLLKFYSYNKETSLFLRNYAKKAQILLNTSGISTFSNKLDFEAVHEWDDYFANPKTTLEHQIICELVDIKDSCQLVVHYSSNIHNKDSIKKIGKSVQALIEDAVTETMEIQSRFFIENTIV